jgi:hypothetical protein
VVSEILCQLAVGNPWVIKSPRVYRYLAKKWVDEFFASGSLQLSSFAKFRENPDERTGDKNEGDAILVGINGKQTAYVVLNYTPAAYVLCTSLKLTREVAADFGYDGCFRINDTLRWTPKTGQAGSLTQTQPNDPHVKETSSA